MVEHEKRPLFLSEAVNTNQLEMFSSELLEQVKLSPTLTRSQRRRNYLKEAKRQSRARIRMDPDRYQLELEAERERTRKRRSIDPEATKAYGREQMRKWRERQRAPYPLRSKNPS